MIRDPPRSNPTVQIPRWDDHPTASIHPTFGGNATPYDLPYDSLTALHRYLPSNADPDDWSDLDIPVDAFSCDEFRMLEFKVKKCARARSHDWTKCPYAHLGEKARRRDPRKYRYSAIPCPEYRKDGCRKGDSCEYAHGVFECWLHPDRYRTQPCKDGTHCRRRVCFFAHTAEQLRVVPHAESYDGYTSRSRGCFDSGVNLSSSSSSPSESPPMSPTEALRMSGLAESMRNLQIAANTRMGMGSPMGSRSPFSHRPGFASLPATPTRSRPNLWEPPMERVESGRDLRARMYAKLCMENSVDSGNPVPDFGWIAELVN